MFWYSPVILRSSYTQHDEAGHAGEGGGGCGHNWCPRTGILLRTAEYGAQT